MHVNVRAREGRARGAHRGLDGEDARVELLGEDGAEVDDLADELLQARERLGLRDARRRRCCRCHGLQHRESARAQGEG